MTINVHPQQSRGGGEEGAYVWQRGLLPPPFPCNLSYSTWLNL